MQELIQSAFLYALGKAIAASIWQTGLLFLLYQSFIFLFRIKQASVKNWLSSFFALSGFVWFISSIFIFWNKQATTSVVLEGRSISNQFLETITGVNRLQLYTNWIEFKLNFILSYLSVAYLFVLLWFIFKLIVQLQSANDLRTKGIKPVHHEMQSYFNMLVEAMGLHKQIELFISTKMDIPATIGFLKPIVLLPVTSVTHLTAEQLEAVLLHELAHIKRNDYFWNVCLSVAETMLFFNPFALLLISIARKERENSCDDMVMNAQQNATVYAEALLKVETVRTLQPKLAMALGDNRAHLLNRVKRILNLPAEKNKISSRLVALLFFTLVFALMGWMIEGNQKSKVKSKQPYFQLNNNKETYLFLSADSLLQKENENISIANKEHKFHFIIPKHFNREELFIKDEEGNQKTIDKLIFKDLPDVLMPPYPEQSSSVFLAEPPQPAEPFIFYFDSSFKKQFRKGNEKNILAEWFNHSPALEQMQVEKFFNHIPPRHFVVPSIPDSVFQKMQYQSNEALIWNGFVPEAEQENTLTEQQIELQYRLAEDAMKQQKEKRVLVTRSKIVSESARTKERIKKTSPMFYSFVQPQSEKELFIEEPLEVRIENNKVFINGKQVTNVDTSGTVNNQQKQIKIKRRLEVIRL
jgi:beta-lactamase regulating signal transducer with metallopeptidase domain